MIRLSIIDTDAHHKTRHFFNIHCRLNDLILMNRHGLIYRIERLMKGCIAIIIRFVKNPGIKHKASTGVVMVMRVIRIWGDMMTNTMDLFRIITT